ncbi:hypothetical protein ACFFX0_09900 [Citricoccus parietis]|uniref:Uncharacterized protein n=1 Tax=Citricoccus parietis TaxID=592307 RepID=A0ABV5FXT8_9MICC
MPQATSPRGCSWSRSPSARGPPPASPAPPRCGGIAPRAQHPHPPLRRAGSPLAEDHADTLNRRSAFIAPALSPR